MSGLVKSADFLEEGETFGDLRGVDCFEAFETEGFDVVAGHDAAIDDGLAKGCKGHIAAFGFAGEESGESASEGVSGTGGIVDIFEGIGRAAEELAFFAEEQAAVFAFFDGDVLRAEGLDGASGFDQAGLAGELARLAVVENEHVDAAKEADERVFRDVDPEIHGVCDDKSWRRDLVEDVVLQIGRNVGEEDDGWGAVGFRQNGGEMLEDVEFHGAGFASVHVPHVFTRPAKGFARDDLESVEIDLAAFEKFDVFFWEIFADDTDEEDGAEIGSGDRAVGCRTAEKVEVLGERGFDVIQRNGTNNENGHKRRSVLVCRGGGEKKMTLVDALKAFPP